MRNNEGAGRGSSAMTTSALVLLSGGLDSAVCLYFATGKEDGIVAISFDYFERRERERSAARRLAQRAKVELISLDVSFMKEVSDDPLILRERPDVESVYMPARNIIFYGIASHFAERMGAARVYGGHTSTDSGFFKDASKAFFEDFNALLHDYTGSTAVSIVTPLIGMNKAEVVSFGSKLGVPYELTWSCYQDGPNACRKCRACRERAQAFASAGLSDPVS